MLIPPHSIHMFLMQGPKSTTTEVPETPSDLAFTLMNLLHHSVTLAQCTQWTCCVFHCEGTFPLHGNQKEKKQEILR